MQLMYPYGPSAGDSEIPNTYEYSWQCFKIDIPDDGMQFFGKRHYKVYVRIYDLLAFSKIVWQSPDNRTMPLDCDVACLVAIFLKMRW